jgi:ribokinase
MKPKIIVVGSSNTDMIIKVPHLPVPGETVLGDEFHMVHGGKGANQAVAAARAGGQVIFISCLGSDTFGKNALEKLKNEGIDTTYIKISDEKPSGVAMINVASSGENSISVAPGANSLLLPEDIEKAGPAFKDADIVLLQLEIPLETVTRTVSLAREYNLKIILNPAPARELDPSLLRMIDIITPNETEASILVSAEEEVLEQKDLIKKLKELGLETVIITLGEQGVVFSSNGQEGHVSGNKVEVIDTTAAGDTFNGYLAVALAGGGSLDESIRIANQAASVSVTRLGASTSIPYLGEFNS